MAEDRRAGAATVISLSAGIAAAWALLASRRAQAATPGGEFVLPDEFVQLIIAMASSAGVIEGQLQQVIEELAKVSVNVQGWPPNTKRIRAFTTNCVLVGTAYRASEMPIPDGMGLIIRSHPANAVGSLVHVAATAADCLNPNSAYPLQPSELVVYNIQNAHDIYVSSTAAGSIVVFSAEQEV